MSPKRTCPNCGSTKVVPIAYGLPGPDLINKAERNEVAIGGCIVSGNDPDLYCNECGHEWIRPRRVRR